eukprot:TRINITY_DN161_c0_g1_i2.p1 TRINITY_DN161_c0_g1~~TRINITY_DN161_c0_g1_i2.p1  ORF type:complete len:346 (-),score=25.82 TRINITY_DN161_c0_g1_i2:256-1293(-)
MTDEAVFCVNYFLPPDLRTGISHAWEKVPPTVDQIKAYAPGGPSVFLTFQHGTMYSLLDSPDHCRSAWLLMRTRELDVVVYPSVEERQSAVTDMPTGNKRLRTDGPPSNFHQPSVARACVPGPSPPVRQIRFIAGREWAVDAATAMPAGLASPEFGLIKDAAHGRLVGRVPPHFVEAAEALCAQMALIYDCQFQRQEAFMRWFSEFLPGLELKLPQQRVSSSDWQSNCSDSQSSASSSNEPVNHESQCIIADVDNNGRYVILIVEVKNEEGSSGEGYFQLFRCFQASCRCATVFFSFQESKLQERFTLTLRCSLQLCTSSTTIEVVQHVPCCQACHGFEVSALVY